MLDLLCKSRRGNVFFYQKGKKKNVCFQRRPRHQPDSPSLAVQMRYTAFTAGQSRAELHPGGMRAWRCGSWPAPGSLGGKIQSVRRAQRDQQEAPVAASAVKCFCSAHTALGRPDALPRREWVPLPAHSGVSGFSLHLPAGLVTNKAVRCHNPSGSVVKAPLCRERARRASTARLPRLPTARWVPGLSHRALGTWHH